MIKHLTFSDFLQSAPGQYLTAWESAHFDNLVEDAFGFEAIQIGASSLNCLRNNRISSQWLIDETAELLKNHPHNQHRHLIAAKAESLPLKSEAFDLVILPHTLDFSPLPQQTLREAVRILRPEGRLILTAFNPLGPWWLRQQTMKLGAAPYLPTKVMPIALTRLKDWFKLLGLELDCGHFGVYLPAFRSETRLKRWQWLNKAGDRWTPQLANLVILSALKRQPGTKLIGKVCFDQTPLKASPSAVLNKTAEFSKTPTSKETTP